MTANGTFDPVITPVLLVLTALGIIRVAGAVIRRRSVVLISALLHVAMGVAMLGMVSQLSSSVHRVLWVPVFGFGALWGATRVWAAAQSKRSPAGVPHALLLGLGCGAMVYMLLETPNCLNLVGLVCGGHMAAMSTMAGSSPFSVQSFGALAFAGALVVVSLWDIGRTRRDGTSGSALASTSGASPTLVLDLRGARVGWSGLLMNAAEEVAMSLTMATSLVVMFR